MDEERERRAEWVAVVVTAQTGHVVTKAQLLGTVEEEKATKRAEAERALAKLDEKRRAAGLLHD